MATNFVGIASGILIVVLLAIAWVIIPAARAWVNSMVTRLFIKLRPLY